MFNAVARSAARGAAFKAVRPVGMTAVRLNSGPGAHAHETESYEQFNNRYLTFFSSCNDLFELQRGLNNCFAYDLVPAPSVIEAALQSARRINNYGSAVRILDAVKVKVENPGQYKTYLDELKGTIQELGITTKEELYGTQ